MIGNRIRITTEDWDGFAVIREIHPDHWVVGLEDDGLLAVIPPNGLKAGKVQLIEPFECDKLPQVGDIWQQCGVDFEVETVTGDLVFLVSKICTTIYPAAFVCNHMKFVG
ncbi:hypothetical protein E6Q11_01310 [Candidatus Dojkabacteria bacterium]|uniref:Uncharacterized protein n=1 Tax=Candidatus Dojkabacteria bacterium TaxID=2099670 RepID=A0A5C7J9T6_9BACT|nr:MAG: hypothetical protein E6Q11_01310 [Candidatus Dojkabacteria bacterium]